MWLVQEWAAELERIQFLSLVSSLIGLQAAGPETPLAPKGAKKRNCPANLCGRFLMSDGRFQKSFVMR